MNGSGRRSTPQHELGRRARTPAPLARHYGRAGYDVVALTDHWHRSDAPSNPRSSCSRGSSSTARCPTTETGTCSGSGSGSTRPSSRVSAATSRRPANGSSRRGRSRVSRAPLLDGCAAGRVRAARVRRGNRGLQRGLRARGGARPLVGALGRAARDRRACPGARHRRQPSPRLRLRPRLDVGARGAVAGERARGAAHRTVLRQHRPGDPRRGRPGGRGRGALHACALGDAL